MIILSEQDLLKAASPSDYLEAIESSFKLEKKGRTFIPDRTHIDKEGNTLLLMPGFLEDYFGTKLVSVYPHNKSKGEPVIYGTVMLNDASTGKPVALINGSKLTALRTGAVGGLGIKTLTNKKIESVGIVGAGYQGIHQAIFAATVRDIKAIHIFDLSQESLEKFQNEVHRFFPELTIKIHKNTGTLIEQSEAIITATTSPKPVLPDDLQLLKGKTYIAMGSFQPAMRELPDALFSLIEECYVDTLFAKEESGDLAIPIQKGLLKENNVYTIGSVLNKKLPDRGTQLFKSVGMSLFDVVTARMIYEKAIEKKIGTEVKF